MTPIPAARHLLPLTLALATAAGWATAQDAIRKVTSMPHGRSFHGACVLGDYLYVIGGASFRDNKGDFSQVIDDRELTTLVAPILPDGDLGEWRTTTTLPQPRLNIESATVVLNDVVYIIGGTDLIDNGERHSTILMSRPMPDGHLGPWEVAATMPESGLSFTATFATPGWLHMVGGVTGSRTLSNRTWSVEVKPDGHLGEWRPGPSLPTPLWYHNAGVSAGQVYVFGGLASYPQATQYSTLVYRAPLLGDGTMGEWATAGSLERPFYGGQAASMGPYLMSFLGRYAPGNAGENNDVWWTVAAPGGLDAWKRLATTVDVRRYHAVATDFRHFSFYLVGGKNSAISAGGRSSVYRFRMSDQARQVAERGFDDGASANLAASTVATSTIEVAGPPATPPARLAIDNLPAYFLPYQMATPYDQSGNARPMVMYFMARDSRPTKEQNAVLAGASLDSAAKRAVFATVDVAATPQVAQQRGVFRVPTWLFFDSRGNLVDRKVGQLGAAELADRVGALK